MAEKGKFETAETRIRTAYSKFGVFTLVVGLFALVATIVGVVVMLRTEETEVAAQVLSCGELTEYSPIAELKGHFTYTGEDVAHLWKLTVKFINSGDKTIVGEGNQKNIIGEGINFVFPDDTRILNIEEEVNTFQSTITQPEQNQIRIQFSQWRSGEYRIISLYVASDEPLDADPLPTAPARDIIDGDILIEDLTERGPLELITMIDRLPRPISLAGKIIGGVSAGLLATILIIMVPWSWKESVPFIMWKRRYLSSFVNYLDHAKPKLSNYRKQRYTSTPYVAPKTLWANFDGPEVPPETPMFKSIANGILITAIFVGVAFGLVSLILMLFTA